MNILLAEDEEHKINEIVQELEDANLDLADLTITNCVRDSVLPVLERKKFDLVILDMALPTHSGVEEYGGHEQPSGGIEVIRALHECSSKPEILIITQHEEITINGKTVNLNEISQLVKRRYKQNSVNAILYSYNEDGWKIKFQDALIKMSLGEK